MEKNKLLATAYINLIQDSKGETQFEYGYDLDKVKGKVHFRTNIKVPELDYVFESLSNQLEKQKLVGQRLHKDLLEYNKKRKSNNLTPNDRAYIRRLEKMQSERCSS
jgi:hypothetical protein